MQTEQLPAARDFRRIFRGRVDVLADRFIQVERGHCSLRAKGAQDLHLLNATQIRLLPIELTNPLRSLLLTFRLGKGEIFTIVKGCFLLIDEFGVVGNPTVLCLAENLVQHSYRDNAAVDQLYEHISGTDALQLVGITDQKDFCPQAQSFEQLVCKATYPSWMFRLR